MANLITGSRIVLSVALLFCPALSPVFFVLYIVVGITDMIDGAVARRTGTVCAFGARLDTVADIVFTTVCLFKLLPVLDVPVWLCIWIAVIAVIKVGNIAVGYLRQKKLISVHSIPNKVTGLLLFIFPLTLTWIHFKYSAAVICAAATVAAVHEGWLVQMGRTA